jgi:hypothetical protein
MNTKLLALAAALALLLATLSTAAGQAATPARVAPYAFQGDQLGVMTLDGFAAKYGVPTSDCEAVAAEDGGMAGEQVCEKAKLNGDDDMGRDSIAGALAEIRYYFLEGKLAAISVMFGRWQFAAVRAALVHKYGPPRASRQTYRNGFGVTFSGLVLTWDNGLSDIEMDEIGERGAGDHRSPDDMSSVFFMHKRLMAKSSRLLGRRNP